MKYKAIVFDLFGTLVNIISGSKNKRMLGEMALALSVPTESFIRLWADTFDKRATGFFKTTEETVRYVCKELGVLPSGAQIKQALLLRHDFLERTIVPRMDCVEVLSNIKAALYKTGLITDCSAGILKYWEKLPFTHLIDVPVFSYLAGMKKPDPRIYQLVLEQLEVQPGDCLYIGDGGSQELTGAAAVGMNPVLIRHSDEVSYETDYDREDWNGTVISSLTEVLDLLK